jgi:hypothetical protein
MGGRTAMRVTRLGVMINFQRISFLAVCATVAVPRAPQPHTGRPFAIGERAVYDVRFGFIHAGTGSLAVMDIDTVRNRAAWRFRLTFSAGVNLLLYKYSVRDTMQSWVDTATLQSLRFNQDQVDGGRTRVKRYEIFPERRAFTDAGKPEQASVADPLDDLSFLFFVRTQDLTVGTTRVFPRHFKPESNPVILKVLRKDTIEAAGRTWNTIVVQPIIKTSTIFSDGGRAQVWISDDPARVIVQINSRWSFGSITMKLRSYQASARAAESPGAARAIEELHSHLRVIR